MELALLWPFSLGGDVDRPSTAESTLVSGSVMMAVVGGWWGTGEALRCGDGYGMLRRVSYSYAKTGDDGPEAR